MSMYLNAVGDIAFREASLGDAIPQADTLTVAGWIKIISDINAGTAIFERYGNATGTIWQGLYIDSTGTAVRVNNSNSGGPSASTDIGVGTWTHVAYTRNGTTHTLFVNGVAEGTCGGDPGADVSPSFAIGGNGVTNTGDAEYAHFRIWEAALSESEIAAEMGSAVPVRTTNLWADYRFVSGSLTTDSSGNSRTLRLNGTVDNGASDPVFDPVLSSPTSSNVRSSTATIGATTDVANGTMYAVVDTVTTEPSTAELEAGQDGDGGAATWSGSQAISSTGAKTFSVTGLAPNTEYTYFIGHKDAAGNFSNIVSGTFSTFQRAAPTSTVTAGSWAPSTGASLPAMIDEQTPDDGDYIATQTPGDYCEFAISVLIDPATGTNHLPAYRIWGNGTSGMEVTVKQGATTIATFTHDPAPTSITTYNQTLSGTEADSITDYSDLRMGFREI